MTSVYIMIRRASRRRHEYGHCSYDNQGQLFRGNLRLPSPFEVKKLLAVSSNFKRKQCLNMF